MGPSERAAMADNTTDESTDAPETGDEVNESLTPTPKADDIEAMKAALRKANEEAKANRLRVKELEDRDKSETEKLSEATAAATRRADEAEARALRLEVAADKGLTPQQARRLVGDSLEDLQADADELLASFKPEPSSRFGDKPVESLKPAGADKAGGNDDDIDYEALARSV